jgi:hypothetical protein
MSADGGEQGFSLCGKGFLRVRRSRYGSAGMQNEAKTCRPINRTVTQFWHSLFATVHEVRKMKERPIIFSTPMVKAILAGRKTQTRRILKRSTEFKGPYNPAYVESHKDHKGWARICPYGSPGDRLWVRETWGHTGHGVWKVSDARMASLNGKVVYRADDDTPGGWFPSIHMPREFARIFLKVTDVRVERLRDISEYDAKAEAPPEPTVRKTRHQIAQSGTSNVGSGVRDDFRHLWESINGAGSWDKNPWVYALTFERVEALEKAA